MPYTHAYKTLKMIYSQEIAGRLNTLLCVYKMSYYRVTDNCDSGMYIWKKYCWGIKKVSNSLFCFFFFFGGGCACDLVQKYIHWEIQCFNIDMKITEASLLVRSFIILTLLILELSKFYLMHIEHIYKFLKG